MDDSFYLCMTVLFNTQPVVNFFLGRSFVSFHNFFLFTNYAAKFIEKCQTSFAVLQVVFKKYSDLCRTNSGHPESQSINYKI